MDQLILKQAVQDGAALARQAAFVPHHYPSAGRGRHGCLRIGRIIENEDTLRSGAGIESCAGMEAVVTHEEDGLARVYVLYHFDPILKMSIWVGPIQLFSEYIESEDE